MKTFGSLFTGFGGADIGAMAVGLKLAWGVELDPAIAAVANGNLGHRHDVAQSPDPSGDRCPRGYHVPAVPGAVPVIPRLVPAAGEKDISSPRDRQCGSTAVDGEVVHSNFRVFVLAKCRIEKGFFTMAVEWTQAPDEVVQIAQDLIKQFHPKLEGAAIAFVFRSVAPSGGGKLTLGRARKVTAEMALFLDYDFVIWLAADWYHRLTGEQQEALIDHELCHCSYTGEPGDEKAFIRHHDIEEFNCILERHGFWHPFAGESKAAAETAVQKPLLVLGLDAAPKSGKVEAPDPAAVAAVL